MFDFVKSILTPLAGVFVLFTAVLYLLGFVVMRSNSYLLGIDFVTVPAPIYLINGSLFWWHFSDLILAASARYAVAIFCLAALLWLSIHYRERAIGYFVDKNDCVTLSMFRIGLVLLLLTSLVLVGAVWSGLKRTHAQLELSDGWYHKNSRILTTTGERSKLNKFIEERGRKRGTDYASVQFYLTVILLLLLISNSWFQVLRRCFNQRRDAGGTFVRLGLSLGKGLQTVLALESFILLVYAAILHGYLAKSNTFPFANVWLKGSDHGKVTSLDGTLILFEGADNFLLFQPCNLSQGVLSIPRSQVSRVRVHNNQDIFNRDLYDKCD